NAAVACDPRVRRQAAERVLRHVFGVFLEEVISRMSDYVPPSEVVRHIIRQYGGRDFGGFRSTLLGLLGSCAYEQAIMASAQRLISRGVFATIRQHRNLAAGRLPPTALKTQAPAQGQDTTTHGEAGGPGDPRPNPASEPPAAIDSEQTPAASSLLPVWQQHAAALRGGGGGAAAGRGGGGGGAPFTSLTRSGGMAAWAVHGSSSSSSCGELALPLAPAGDLQGVRASGQFQAALEAGVWGPVAGVTRGSLTVPAPAVARAQ
ncbi:hypothetical protein Agub_g3813, partial [Astrephomene gubernaculifera]